MKITKATWQTHVELFGEYEARRRLRSHRNDWSWQFTPISKRDPLTLIYDMVHGFNGSPCENRKKFAKVIRALVICSENKRLGHRSARRSPCDGRQ